MKINHVCGNILNAKETIIGHQTNVYGVMGAGLALQLKNKYPDMYREYNKLCNATRCDNLIGTVQMINVPGDKIIANIFSQEEMSFTRTVTNYDAMREAFVSLKDTNLSIALPFKIGCGIAGGDWDIVYKIIEEVFSDYEPGLTLYEYNPNKVEF